MGEPDYEMFRRKLPLLASLPDADLGVLLKAASLKRLPARSVLAVEGQPATTAYMLMKGSVRLSRAQKHGVPTVLGDVSEGTVVGAIGLLDTGDYMTSAEAITDVMALVVDRDRFYSLGTGGEAAVYRVIRVLAPQVVTAVRRALGLIDGLFADREEGVRQMERLVLAISKRRA